jgi:chromosome segregation ATPase
MADLLDGVTGHTNYAPLSHGQTMSVGRHLQDQIRQLQLVIADLGKGLSETHEAVADLRKHAGNTHAQLYNLQERTQGSSTLLETQLKELARTNSNVCKLQSGLEGMNANVVDLLDTRKLNETTMNKIQRDVDIQAQRQHEFKDKIEKRIEADIRSLRDDFMKSDLALNQLKGDQDGLKTLVQNEKEQLRLTNMRAKNAEDRFNEMDTFMKIVEKRVADTTSNLKTTRTNLEDLNTATLKMHEDHDNTKVRLAEQNETLKKTNNHVKLVHNKLEATAQATNNAHEKLAQHADNAEDLKQKMDHAYSNIQSVAEGNDRANSTISDLARQLQQTDATTRALKAGLKESNALLLPNLHLDSQEARSASARHGSLLQTGNISIVGGPLPSPKKTSRASTPRGSTLQNWT